MLLRVAISTTCLSLALTAIARADRLDDFNKLDADYKAAENKFFETHVPKKDATAADKIRINEAWPGWQYLPRFVALAEADPTDEAAYRSCMWVLSRPSSDRATFAAEQKVWRIIAANQSQEDKVPRLCFQAVQNFGPAQEKFLRGLLKQPNLSRERAGFATLALAELLARRVDSIDGFAAEDPAATKDEFAEYLKQRIAPEWKQLMIPANAERFKTESLQLFRLVLDRYADVPCTISMPYFRDIKKLGDKAEKSVHALEHLTVGAEAPDIVGKDLSGHTLKLKDYRGRVVLLSFWFTGCGPCLALVPEERKLLETFKNRPFTLLSVSTDEDLSKAQMTAKEHKIDWPCWFDGGDSGPIASAYNVLSWPTLYLLDKNGRIVAKDIDRDHMAEEVAKLLDKEN